MPREPTSSELCGDPAVDRAIAMRDAARVGGHQTNLYREGLEREYDDPAEAARVASQAFATRMAELGQSWDDARARERPETTNSRSRPISVAA
ncbi:MAG: hypothetical protein ACREQ5_19655 [Candidatus Dormibacteria bacterium]